MAHFSIAYPLNHPQFSDAVFTGIVQTIGEVVDVIDCPKGDVTVHINAPDYDNYVMGESIAVDGVCLTVVGFEEHTFFADVSKETLGITALSLLSKASQVNLERAMKLQDVVSGHLMSGHVDAMGEILSFESSGHSYVYRIAVPEHLSRFIARKGSVALNGISLTVNNLSSAQHEAHWFEVNIVPHTYTQTTMHVLSVGKTVNIEIDLIARYLDRLHGIDK